MVQGPVAAGTTAQGTPASASAMPLAQWPSGPLDVRISLLGTPANIRSEKSGNKLEH